ncbi:MAG TPA: tripartite tricarboxylate transporter substrate binding protein, partial [Burkholderiales bacterium]|nr:tripartite tricarboxylate transporter substrate binding protein [Burkholderiales bacterium]
MLSRSLVALAAALSAAALPGNALAQTYPARPVKLIVTYPPGGSSDLMGRVLAQKLGEHWGQQVIVESKPGAAGSIGMEFAARQPADGYAFVIGNFGPVAINPLLSKLPYDIQRDFLPVSMVCTGPNILVVNSATPANNVKELVALAKTNPGKLNFGTSGPGSMSHLVGEMFKRVADINIVQVPYKGGVLAVQDLIGGQVQLIFSDALPVMQHIRAGKLRPLAITSRERSPLSPEIPTLAEQGYPELVAVNWWGVLMPTGTPRPIIEKLNADLV